MSGCFRLTLRGIFLDECKLPGLRRDLNETVLEIAIDTVFLNPLADDVIAAPLQVPDERSDTVAVLLRDLPETAHAVDHLPAVAPGGAPANAVGLDERDRVAPLGKCQRGRDAGEARADDADIRDRLPIEFRVVRRFADRRSVIGVRVFLSLMFRSHGLIILTLAPNENPCV